MAKAKLKLYPYAQVGQDGKLSHIAAYVWKVAEKVEGDGTFTFNLPSIDLEVEVPDDFRPACVALLDQHTGKLRTEHQNLLTRFQFQRNTLLGLAAPEVVDAAPSVRDHLPPASDVDDDIPF